MAGQISSFVNGSMLVIRIGKVQFAYCQSLSFNENMTVIPTTGIGSYSFSGLEPVQFAASGNMRILRWSNKLATQVAGATTAEGYAKKIPANLDESKGSSLLDGNSLLDKNSFNPASLIISATFDIDVYQRGATESVLAVQGTSLTGATDIGPKLYTLQDCRMTNYSYSFVPGSLLFEDVSYVVTRVLDAGSST